MYLNKEKLSKKKIQKPPSPKTKNRRNFRKSDRGGILIPGWINRSDNPAHSTDITEHGRKTAQYPVEIHPY